MTGEKMGLDEQPAGEFTSYEEVEAAFYRQFDSLCRHAIILTLEAQRLHQEMVPRPFLSSCIEHCMASGKDLSQGGAKYNIGPVITGIGLAVTANSLAAVKKLVFADRVCDMATLVQALRANWVGYEDLRPRPKPAPSTATTWTRWTTSPSPWPTIFTGRSTSTRIFSAPPSSPPSWASPITSPWAGCWGPPPTGGSTASLPAKGSPLCGHGHLHPSGGHALLGQAQPGAPLRRHPAEPAPEPPSWWPPSGARPTWGP